MHPLLDPISAHHRAAPDKPVVADASLVLSGAEFLVVARHLAKQITSRNTGAHVGVLAPPSAAGAVAIAACWCAGRVPVPLNFLLGPDELHRVTRDAGLDLILSVRLMAEIAERLGIAALVLDANSMTPDAGGGTHADMDTAAGIPSAAPEDLGAILYTSATTGDPKGVRLSFDNLIQNALTCAAHARLDHRHVFLSVLPQFHSFGFTAMTVVPLMLGATVRYLPRFSPAAVVDALSEHRVGVFMAVASMYAALLRLKGAGKEEFASLHLAISGGEPLPPRVSEAFAERFGVEIQEGYGLTETSPVVSLNMPWARRPTSVGRPLPGITVSAVDTEGRQLPPGAEGELTVTGHCVMQGYHNRPAETAGVLRGGRFFTGDLGRVDSDGFVYITGRVKDLIIVGGENVYPREIENVLCEHPAVAEAAVIGVPDELRGETPAAFVILREGAATTETELRAFCRQHLAGYKQPRSVQICSELPRGPTGKILKRALRAQTK